MVERLQSNQRQRRLVEGSQRVHRRHVRENKQGRGGLLLAGCRTGVDGDFAIHNLQPGHTHGWGGRVRVRVPSFRVRVRVRFVSVRVRVRPSYKLTGCGAHVVVWGGSMRRWNGVCQ